MFDLRKIVIPKIMNEWEDIADALHYDLATIRAIKKRTWRSKEVLSRILQGLVDD